MKVVAQPGTEANKSLPPVYQTLHLGNAVQRSLPLLINLVPWWVASDTHLIRRIQIIR